MNCQGQLLHRGELHTRESHNASGIIPAQDFNSNARHWIQGAVRSGDAGFYAVRKREVVLRTCRKTYLHPDDQDIVNKSVTAAELKRLRVAGLAFAKRF